MNWPAETRNRHRARVWPYIGLVAALLAIGFIAGQLVRL